jgi:phosphohistidine phosphatase
VAQQLWFLRHGEAVPHGSKPDFDRELTTRGERQSESAGAALAGLGVEFDACYTSPKVRARDTARIACKALGVEPVEVESLAGDVERQDVLELLEAHGADARVLVVGHEPDFSQLVYDLTGGRIVMKKGGVAAVRLEGSDGRVMTLLRPKELEAMG